MQRTLAVSGALAALLSLYSASAYANEAAKQWPPKTYKEDSVVTKLKTDFSEEKIKHALENLSSEDNTKFEKAVYVFEQMGSQAVPIIVRELRHGKEDETLRVNALYVLGRMGDKSENAVFLVTSFLRNSDANTRAVAAAALGKIGPKAHYALPMLEKLKTDDDQWVRDNASVAIARIGVVENAANPPHSHPN